MLSIKTDSKEFKVKCEDESKLFDELTVELIGKLKDLKDSTSKRVNVPAQSFTGRIHDFAVTGGTIKATPASPVVHETTEEGYFGFLAIKCSKCGKLHFLYSKNRIVKFQCAECNEYTELKELKLCYAHCECGRRTVYRTNVKDKAFDVNCIECKAPVAVIFNEKKDIFKTIKEDY